MSQKRQPGAMDSPCAVALGDGSTDVLGAGFNDGRR
jgi:hypothetical protein